MNIIPLAGQVYLRLEQDRVGKFDVSSRESAVEYAEVLAIGMEGENMATHVGKCDSSCFRNLKVGDYVFVKAWALDCVKHEGKSYYFINIESGGILAKVEQ